MQPLGQYMQGLREARSPKLSQKDVADRAQERRPEVKGILQHTISRWERGTASPDAEQLDAWLDALAATPEERLAAVDRNRRPLPPGVVDATEAA